MKEKINVSEGLLFYIIEKIRPELAERIKNTNTLETMIIGLGAQGIKHAALMRRFGTSMTAGVVAGKGGTRVHETIPVYNTVAEALENHPYIAVSSIWKHYSSAKNSAMEAIEAGIPLIVLISEFIPIKDMRDILTAARKHNTLLIGGNTPGLIFPPERIKIGMLPDIFQSQVKKSGLPGAKGVTIISRSGAILYHMADAMSSVGIAQNAVIGIGGDAAVGSTFKDLVPLAMEYKNTDAVVVAGEIGGCQEEVLARDIQENPQKYSKPLIALISGAYAPEGKTMGHAGAIVAPGGETGTFISKKQALEAAGVTVVNNQYDLITAVQEALHQKQYFDPEKYFIQMKEKWESPPTQPHWSTLITEVKPNNVVVRGYTIQDIISHCSLLEAARLIIQGEIPDERYCRALNKLACDAARKKPPSIPRNKKEDISKSFQKYLLNDEDLVKFQPQGDNKSVEKSIYCLGRFCSYLAEFMGNHKKLTKENTEENFSGLIYSALTGEPESKNKLAMIEAMITACIDHGITPPSVQATLIAASVRADYEVAVAQGVGAITDVHGGAGKKAAEFFTACVDLAKQEKISLKDATYNVMKEYIDAGKRIEGMGHRLHTQDPRKEILWSIADKNKISGDCVKISKIAGDIFQQVRGIDLPVNVDGVIGAIVADMGLDLSCAKAIFIFGRICGLSAHYFEEIVTQSPMRRINFSQARYEGTREKKFHKT